MLKGIPDGLKVLITFHISPSIHYRVVVDKTGLKYLDILYNKLF